MEQQNSFFEFIKNLIAGAAIVITAVVLSFLFVGFVIFIPFVLVSFYGMIFIRPTLSNPRDIRTCWFSLARFYISISVQLTIGFLIFAVFGYLGIFCLMLIGSGDFVIIPALVLCFCVWIMYQYCKQLFAKSGKGGKGNRECFRLALAGRF